MVYVRRKNSPTWKRSYSASALNGRTDIKGLLLAIQFLTIITLLPNLRATTSELRSSLSYFPLVGLIIGGLLAGFDWAAKELWPPYLVGILDTGFLIIVTRGLHLDGLADTADGLGSCAPTEKALEIMKDSRTGALGVITLILVLMLKAGALTSISQKGAWQLLILAPCLSRWGLNVLSSASSYARLEGGLGEAFVGRKNWYTLGLAGPTALAAGWALGELRGVAAVMIVTIWSLFIAMWFRKRLGGVTGDVLGGHVELTEALLLLIGVAFWA